MGPCMCGDTRCSSCGPAQGNYKCSFCGKWAEDGGCDDPEKCAAEAAKFEEEYAKQEAEWREQEEKYMRGC